MRSQSWFVCDGRSPLVGNLFLYGEGDGALADGLAPHGVGPLPWLNRSRRVEQIYASDFALIESVRAQRASRGEDVFRAAAIAAE